MIPDALMGDGTGPVLIYVCAVLDRNGRKWAGFLELRSSHEAYILSRQMLGYGAAHGTLRSPHMRSPLALQTTSAGSTAS